MRIITGTAKGKRLKTLEGDATRPTSERMKEAIFSAIQFDLEDRTVLDLFAGCGQLGLEALSRGAKSAMFVDASNDAITVVKQNAQATDFFSRSRFLTSDYRNYIRKAARRDSFDLVFIDPPYALGEERGYASVLATLAARGAIRPGGLFIAEMTAAQGAEETPGWEVVRDRTYGKTRICIWRRAK